MTAMETRRLVHAHLEGFNTRESKGLAESLNTPDARWTNVPAGASYQGPQGYLAFLDSWLSAFPEAKVEVKNVSSGEDWAVAEFRGVGKHAGILKTPAGDIPPTGRAIELPFCEVYRFRGGKIASCNLYFDTGTLVRQLGLA